MCCNPLHLFSFRRRHSSVALEVQRALNFATNSLSIRSFCSAENFFSCCTLFIRQTLSYCEVVLYAKITTFVVIKANSWLDWREHFFTNNIICTRMPIGWCALGGNGWSWSPWCHFGQFGLGDFPCCLARAIIMGWMELEILKSGIHNKSEWHFQWTKYAVRLSVMSHFTINA